MTPNEQFLIDTTAAAKEAGHIFPAMAACEAALESGWGKSELSTRANNLFGQKAPAGTSPANILAMDTKEYLNHAWVTVPARWMRYASHADCFKDRMAQLERLRVIYKDYGLALDAKTPEDYIVAVSRRWSTDPQRGAKVLETYNAHKAVLEQAIA